MDHMPALTIPRKTIKDADLVLLPRKEYEELMRARRTLAKAAAVKRSLSFPVLKKHEKFYEGLDKRLTKSLRDYYRGKYSGPFETPKEVIRFLNRKR